VAVDLEFAREDGVLPRGELPVVVCVEPTPLWDRERLGGVRVGTFQRRSLSLRVGFDVVDDTIERGSIAALEGETGDESHG